MKMLPALLVSTLLLLSVAALAQDNSQSPIDWNYAGQLYRREQAHQPLSDDEAAYLARAKKQRQAQNGRPTTQRSGAAGAGAPAAPTTQQSTTGLIPLDQMSETDRYKGQDGGLYGAGHNEPSAEQLQAAKKALAQVQRLDADGKPSPSGKIVLLSVGMSNTSQEFGRYRHEIQGSKDKSPAVVVVDGAQGGKDAGTWTTNDSVVWQGVQQRLNEARVTSQQVQVIWLKQAIAGAGRFGEFPRSAEMLRDLVIQTIPLLKQHYPNLRVIYLSSRIYAGYATTSLNPEPYAYEGAFAMRWVIQAQMQGDPRLNANSEKGEVKAPVLLWGPYLWADGITPRKSDRLTYEAADLGPDGTHPGPGGQEKVSKLLREFFTNDLNAPWYRQGGPAARP